MRCSGWVKITTDRLLCLIDRIMNGECANQTVLGQPLYQPLVIDTCQSTIKAKHSQQKLYTGISIKGKCSSANQPVINQPVISHVQRWSPMSNWYINQWSVGLKRAASCGWRTWRTPRWCCRLWSSRWLGSGEWFGGQSMGSKVG